MQKRPELRNNFKLYSKPKRKTSVRFLQDTYTPPPFSKNLPRYSASDPPAAGNLSCIIESLWNFAPKFLASQNI